MKNPTAVTRRTPLADLPELLRVNEVAIWADVGRGVVYDAVRRGALPSIFLGRLCRIPRTGLAAWIGAAGDGNGRD